MLKITGNSGKSIIIEAIQKRYDDSRVYSYNDYMVPTMESYHVDSDECTVDEFCQYVYYDISKLGNRSFPISIKLYYQPTHLDFGNYTYFKSFDEALIGLVCMKHKADCAQWISKMIGIE